jgi:hypothetical protein
MKGDQPSSQEPRTILVVLSLGDEKDWYKLTSALLGMIL